MGRWRERLQRLAGPDWRPGTRRESLQLLRSRLWVPKGLREHDRLPLHHPRVPVVVLWSHKAGSTSLLQWFLHHAGLLDEARRHGDWIHAYELDVLKADRSYVPALEQALAARAPAVKVVRDPVARAFSGYLELNQHWAVSHYLDHWTTFWRRRVVRGLFGPDADYHEPFSFVQYLRWYREQRVASLNPHLAPQWTAVEDELGAVLQLRRLEDPDLFSSLEDELGLLRTDPATQAALSHSPHHRAGPPADPQVLPDLLRQGYVIHSPPDEVPRPTVATARVDAELWSLLEDSIGDDLSRYGHLYGL